MNKNRSSQAAAECSLDERACRVGNGHDVIFCVDASGSRRLYTPISSFSELRSKIYFQNFMNICIDLICLNVMLLYV
jgi:hypothetical protein